MTRIRLAAEDDVEPIARIQVAAWRAAYADMLPPGFLAGLTEERRAEQWRGRVGAAMDPGSPTFVATNDAGTVLGFVHTGPIRDEDLSPAGRAEVYTIYVDPASWRDGVGRALMAAVDDFWAGSEVTELTLWVFEENPPARAFYEALGWRADGARQVDDFGDAHPAEVRYRRAMPRRRQVAR